MKVNGWIAVNKLLQNLLKGGGASPFTTFVITLKLHHDVNGEFVLNTRRVDSAMFSEYPTCDVVKF